MLRRSQAPWLRGCRQPPLPAAELAAACRRVPANLFAALSTLPGLFLGGIAALDRLDEQRITHVVVSRLVSEVLKLDTLPRAPSRRPTVGFLCLPHLA